MILNLVISPKALMKPGAKGTTLAGDLAVDKPMPFQQIPRRPTDVGH
jgi:hypothetical protein